VKARLKAASAMLHSEGSALGSKLDQASPHWLRHAFAKAALLQGQSIRAVADLLEHAAVDTTMVYANEDALEAARTFERDNKGLASEA
jgi:integrase/recombinase XerC